MSRLPPRPDAFADPFPEWFTQQPWPARWVAHPRVTTGGPSVVALRRRFDVPVATTARVHVSADERYELLLDGRRVGRGSERGDEVSWFYETYDLPLSPGRHTLVARAWWHGPLAPYAQVSVAPGFILNAEGELNDHLSTGVAAWDALLMGGYSYAARKQGGHFTSVGAAVTVDGAEFPWGWETGTDTAGEWVPAAVVGPSAIFGHYGELQPKRRLRPALLPAMLERDATVGTVRLVAGFERGADLQQVPVREADMIRAEATTWQSLVRGGGAVTVPPNTRRRVLVDLEDYYCAYPELVTTGGAGAEVRVLWAEALYEPSKERIKGMYDVRHKGNRDVVEGKAFIGMGDAFRPDGGQGRRFDTVWWNAGRYVQLEVTTADAPLTVDRFALRETRYPYEPAGAFDASDPRLAAVVPVMVRGMQMCMHETYVDCPYYEQLMYVGDTRLEVLTTYATTTDDALPKKAVLMFDLSRQPNGLTTSRYPSRVPQVIPPFSLWWVAMVHDLMMWRGERQFVCDRMPAVRGVLDAFRRHVREDGLVASPSGWNFMDWVPGWDRGIPPDGHAGPNGSINWLFAYALKLAAELEQFAGQAQLADRNWADFKRIAKAAAGAFWDRRRGLLAEDLAHTTFSEHSQCLALLCDWGVTGPRRARMIDGLLTAPDLHRTTIYFSHYLFEAYRVVGRVDKLVERMGLWFGLKDNGLRTTVESPEPPRSDCHAWGAHPLFHYAATILGVRPDSPGFETVRVQPNLGPLDWAKGRVPHPRGMIEVDVRRAGDGLDVDVRLPAGVTGTVVHPPPGGRGRGA